MTRAALRAALLVAALAFPAAAQDAPLVVKIVYSTLNGGTFTEGSSGALYTVMIKDGGGAPKGGLTVRVSLLLTANHMARATIGRIAAKRDMVTIPEGMNESGTFVSGFPIPDDGEFRSCNKIVTMLHSINPAVYRIAPMRQGEGFHSVVYADATQGMQSPLCR